MPNITDFTGGLPETFCGAGSTLGRTKEIRRALPGVIERLQIKRLLDVPCGDGNWMSDVDIDVKYFGMDVSGRNVAIANARPWKIKRRKIRQGHAINDPWPEVDAVMCRDFFQHLNFAQIHALLNKIKKSGARYLIGTSYTKLKNREIGPKLYRPINIEVAPFNFGHPIIRMDEASPHVKLNVYPLR